MFTNATTNLPQVFVDIIVHDRKTAELLVPSILPIELGHVVRKRREKRLRISNEVQRFLQRSSN